ncbi:hypothetical protein [Streptomyces murinus]|uniref:hypothetical protein n=1 Tax=Streptomyces murinus TaxID=33900 RepID=UPI0036E1E933
MELSVCGGLLVTILLSLLALVAMLLAVPVILLVPEAVPSWANMPVFCSAVVSLVGGLAALARRSYLRYVRVRQV